MKEKIANIWSNGILFISYACFLILNYQLRQGYILGIIIALGLTVVFLSKRNHMIEIHKEASKRNRILAALCSAGILFADGKLFYEMMLTYDKVDKLIKLLHVSKKGFLIITTICLVIISFEAVYTLLLYFYRFFLNDVLRIVSDLSKKEQIVVSLLFLIGACFTVGVYMVTGAFYGSSGAYDVIYTSDSSLIFKQNCFLWLASGQNDLRQPLFAIISAPFVGIFSALTIPFLHNQVIVACVLQIANIMALIFILVMLSDLLELKNNIKIFFWIMSMTFYPVMLFHIMVEQYIFVVFWLLFFVQMTLKNNGRQDIGFIGAVGGLITNAAMIPLLFYKDHTSWRERIVYVWKTFLKGIFAILVFSRFDIILHCMDGLKGTMSFAGQGLTFTEKWYQYTAFVRSCFIAPDFCLYQEGGLPTWQLAQATQTDWLGVTILLLTVVSFLINRKDIVSRISFGWTAFSLLLLLIVGYGASENGMILYSLYFGWAFWLSLFKLLQNILYRMKCKEVMLRIIMTLITVFLFVINIRGMGEMVSFASLFYPYQ